MPSCARARWSSRRRRRRRQRPRPRAPRRGTGCHGLSGAVAAVLELTCKQRTRTERWTRILPPYRRVVRAKWLFNGRYRQRHAVRGGRRFAFTKRHSGAAFGSVLRRLSERCRSPTETLLATRHPTRCWERRTPVLARPTCGGEVTPASGHCWQAGRSAARGTVTITGILPMSGTSTGTGPTEIAGSR